MDNLREQFDRNVKAKAVIGDSFTVDDVAASLQVPVTDLRSSWFAPFMNNDTIRKVGMKPSRNPKSHGRHVTMYQGTYYLDLEEEERREAESLALAEGYRLRMEQPMVLTDQDIQKVENLLAG